MSHPNFGFQRHENDDDAAVALVLHVDCGVDKDTPRERRG